jgi:glucose/arabinose dehydrogenase
MTGGLRVPRRGIGLALCVALALGVATLPTTSRAANAIRAKVVLSGLNVPTAFTFGPDGTIWYVEKATGRIRIADPAAGTDRAFFDVSGVNAEGERGMLGIALHPRFPARPFVYVYATRSVQGRLRNQILRLTDTDGRGSHLRVIFSATASASPYHNGGRILFGPDGMLYAIVGDGHDAANAQDRTGNDRGKILRMTPSGGRPPSNPFPRSRIWAYGIRNSFGFAFDPRTGRLWETENGPSCNDELNRIVRGRNYGWGPSETCSGQAPRNTNRDGPAPVLPKRWYTPTIAPTGIAFCQRCGLGATSNGTLFFGAYNTGDIRRVRLNADRLGVLRQAIVYRHPQGILSMEVGPDRGLYFSDAGAVYELVR